MPLLGVYTHIKRESRVLRDFGPLSSQHLRMEADTREGALRDGSLRSKRDYRLGPWDDVQLSKK